VIELSSVLREKRKAGPYRRFIRMSADRKIG